MLKFGLIGLGSMGKNHYRILKSIPDVSLIAICDPVVQGDFPEKIYRSHTDMISHEKPDAVVIASPNSTHRNVAIDCIKHGIHVLIEKPVATSVSEGREIMKAAGQADVKTAIGHVERFNPVVISLRSELKGKTIENISITRVGPFPPRIANVGILNDLSVHDIDLIRFISGREIIKKNIFKSKVSDGKGESNAVLSFILEDDSIANITTNWLTPFKKRKIEVATTDSYFEADLMSQELNQYSSYQVNNSFVIRNHFVRKGEPLLNEIAAFSDFIRTGSRSQLATIEDSLKTLEILES